MQAKDVLFPDKTYVATEVGNGVDEGYLVTRPEDFQTDPDEEIREVSQLEDPSAWELAATTLSYLLDDTENVCFGAIVRVWVSDDLMILAEIEN